MSDYLGVILAAGTATRILPLSDYFPKPLLPVGNRPIIEYQITALKDLGITDIFMVVGHLKERLMTHFGDGERLGVRLIYVEQAEAKGIAHALVQLAPKIDRPFIVFLGDIYMNTDKVEEMIADHRNHGCSAVLSVKEERRFQAIQKNFVVIAGDNNRALRVVEKPKRDYGSRLKGCGIYLFDPVVFEAAARTPRTAQRDEYELTDTVQILIDWGEQVRFVQAVEWDINITYPVDLLAANMRYLKANGLENLIGAGAELAPECVINNSVVGENVRIDRPIEITDSLILADVKIDDDRTLHRAIVTEEATVFLDKPTQTG